MQSRTKLKIKNAIKGTKIGKKLRDMYQKRGFTKKNAKDTFDKFVGFTSLKETDKNRIVADMLKEARKYSFGFDEYFMFHFYEKTSEERREYVSCRERISYCERMNSIKNMIIFDDKALSYKVFKKYYKRDLAGIFSENDEDIFKNFISQHERFIVKPFDGAGGYGIQIMNGDKNYPKRQLMELLAKYKKGFVIEELIIQSNELSQLHPESVNTLRMPTVLFKDRTDIIHPVLRVGRGGNIVDNSHSGGISCGIDVDTGKIISAADANGRRYETHPDTGVRLIGFNVPDWEEAKSLAIELARVLPDNKYTGWDLAHTENGWIMQEGNDRGDFDIFQLTSNSGFRKEIEQIVNELGV